MEFNLDGFINVLLFEVSWMEANFFFVLVAFLLYASLGYFFIRVILVEVFMVVSGLFELLLELILLVFVSFPKKIYRMLFKKD